MIVRAVSGTTTVSCLSGCLFFVQPSCSSVCVSVSKRPGGCEKARPALIAPLVLGNCIYVQTPSKSSTPRA